MAIRGSATGHIPTQRDKARGRIPLTLIQLIPVGGGVGVKFFTQEIKSCVADAHVHFSCCLSQCVFFLHPAVQN